MLELTYWTMWALRWAKENERKMYASRTEKRYDYRERQLEWYDLKTEAFAILAHSEYGKLSFYQSENADKINMHLCEQHYFEYQDLRDAEIYHSVLEAYYENPKKYKKCPDCIVEIYKDYYLCFYLEIENDDWKFSFHLPFPIGKVILPSKEQLSRVEHEENEGHVSIRSAYYRGRSKAP